MAKMDEILMEVPKEDRVRVTLECYRFLNSTPDAGRPSDAARVIVRLYKEGRL